jgi:hypothetical protein
MNFRILKLLLLSIAFLGILLAASTLITSAHSRTTLDNAAHKPSTVTPIDDSVAGGFPQSPVPMGDPVDGGFP